MKPALLILAALAMAVDLKAAEFPESWRDGKSELSGYRLSVSRYGQPRPGHAVLIYVTEPFSRSKRVKLDQPERTPADAVEVLKLNLVRDFQTGLYDYNTMTSVFSATADLSPLKISFSSAEWCGHVYEELLLNTGGVRGQTLSYFQGESKWHQLPHPLNGLAEDNLWIVLRGLGGDYLKPGETRSVPLLRSLFQARLSHQPTGWTRLKITRLAEPQTIQVPAGEFATIVYRLEEENGRQGQFHVEAQAPHRIIRWEWAPDLQAELTGTIREPYWQLNRNGDERWLEKLGLQPLAK